MLAAPIASLEYVYTTAVQKQNVAMILYAVFCVCNLFNDAVSSSDSIASNDRGIDE
jgi:hypothetical protein